MQETSANASDHAGSETATNGHTSVKALRYEDASDGIPPAPIRSINPPPRSSSRGQSSRTGTPTSARNAALSVDAKRDSGIAPSVSTVGQSSHTESLMSSSGQGASAAALRSMRLPTIVVHDEDATSSPEPAQERSRSPFARKRSREKIHRGAAADKAGAAVPLARVNSFKGIQAEIPTGSFDDIDLQDLASDKVEFSNRGSLLFGGKKMNEMMNNGQMGHSGLADGVVQPITQVQTKEEEEQEEQQQQQQQQQPPPPQTSEQRVQETAAEEQEGRKQGLKAGRRKPSVQMLQAVVHGGRVLSAEEETFSLKVRNMYEHGDENWTESPQSTNVDNGDTSGEAQDEVSELGPVNGYSIPRPATVQSMRTSYAREYYELAGGIEDWEAIHNDDVDRYGFINTSRVSSRQSTASGRPPEGLHRVATALRVEAESLGRDRKLRRGLSNARSTRSVASRASRDTLRTAPASINGYRSTVSSRSLPAPFVSKDVRTLAEAANMLTLPPALAETSENEAAQKTPISLKKREWERDLKWQKMARPIRNRSNSKGGGMQFDFDTSDPKLINRTWKGIPDRWRATAWHCFLSTSAKRRGPHESDEQLIETFHRLQETSSADDLQIDVDVPRTIHMHIMFRRRYRGGQRLLFRVLHAVSLHFPETGYVQGMASLVATLLCYFDEERAFVMVVRLWQLRGLEQLFNSDFVGLMTALGEFEREWLRGGDVAKKLEELGIPSTAYGTRWYLTLFNLSVPFPAQLRVWDVFMLLGDAPTKKEAGAFGGADLDVLHATSAALIDAMREVLLEADFENAMKVLTSFVPVKDEDLLMRVARTEWRLRKKRVGIKS